MPTLNPLNLDLYAIAQHHRQQLLQREAATSATMVRLYANSAQRIEQRILQLGQQIDEAVARGERVSPSWLYQQERLQAVLTQVQNEIHHFASAAGPLVENVQREFALAGYTNAQDLVTLSRDALTRTRGVASPDAAAASLHVGFGRLASEAAIDLAGFAADGSPLAELFAALGPAAAAEVKQSLFAGIVQGFGAKKLARQVRTSLGNNMARAMLIGRTETLRAYRESSQRFYEDNADVVKAWRWVSACNQRTCAMCWAMHGSIHTIAEQFVSHPGCRCTPVPVTDLSPGMVTGPVRFAGLKPEQQLKVLGPKKFEAFQNGQISLTSLAGMKDNGRWGKTRLERNLKDAIAAHRANTPLPIGPMRAQPKGAPPPTPEPLDVLLPIVDKQLPAVTAAEARQRVAGVSSQYDGLLGSIKDELLQLATQRGKIGSFPAPGQDETAWRSQHDAVRARQAELVKLRTEVVAARGDRLLDILSAPAPANFKANLKAKDKARKATWQNGVDKFKRLVGIDLTNHSVNLIGNRRGRSDYDLKGNVRLSAGANITTVVHELGHWLEDMIPEVHRKAVDFLERRAAGESAVSLKAITGIPYGRSEIAWRDKFMDPYVGKIYRRNFVPAGSDKYHALYATEVVSMGLQWYVERPAEFALQDPDFFDFIFDLVRGR